MNYRLNIKHIQGQASGILSPESGFSVWFAKQGFNNEQRVRFYRKVSAMEENGVKLQTIIDFLKVRADKRSKTDALAIVLHHVQKGLREGYSLGACLRPFVPVTEIMVVQAGEDSGVLHKALLICVDIIIAGKKMRAVVQKALIYPILLSIVLCTSLYIIGSKAMPNIILLVNPETLTGASKGLFILSQIMQTNIVYILFSSLVGLLLLIFYSFPRWRGRIRCSFDKIPPWSIYRLVIGSGWLLSLAALINSGVGILDALKQIKNTVSGRNQWLSERLETCIFALKKGLNLGEALTVSGHGFPDREVIDDLVVYESLPNFETVLSKMGTERIEEVLEMVERQSMILNTGMIFCFACIGFWMLSGVLGIMNSMGGLSGF